MNKVTAQIRILSHINGCVCVTKTQVAISHCNPIGPVLQKAKLIQGFSLIFWPKAKMDNPGGGQGCSRQPMVGTVTAQSDACWGTD